MIRWTKFVVACKIYQGHKHRKPNMTALSFCPCIVDILNEVALTIIADDVGVL
jgi:hypothetical protein